jgi:hypothetical protein
MGAGVDEGDGIGGASASALETRLLEVPGIVSTALLSSLPGGRASTRTFVVEPSQPRVREIRLDVSAFDATQFDREMLVPIAGRGFGGRDDASSCRVALVNETAATRYFDGQTVDESDGTTVEIIGVLGSRDTDARDTPTACRAAVVSELTARTWFGSVAVGGALIDPDGVRVAVVGVVEARPLAVAQPAPRPLAFVPHRQAYQPVIAITATTIEESPRVRRSVDEAVQTVEGVLGLADAVSPRGAPDTDLTGGRTDRNLPGGGVRGHGARDRGGRSARCDERSRRGRPGGPGYRSAGHHRLCGSRLACCRRRTTRSDAVVGVSPRRVAITQNPLVPSGMR